MTSPWKFLARLVSPRRQPKERTDTTDREMPDASEVDMRRSPDKPATGESLKEADDLAIGELKPHEQSASSEDFQSFDEAASSANPGTEVGLLKGVEHGLPDVTDLAEPAPELPGEGKMVKQRTRGKQVEATGAVFLTVPDVVVPSSIPLSLDEEIISLRGQLANKLRLQNAQLKKMLVRFED